MNDRSHDPDLETRLRAAFRADGLPPAPAHLARALERVPDASASPRAARTVQGGRRTTFGLLGVAAALIVGGALVFSSAGGVLPAPSSAPSDAAIGTRITYRVAWTDGVPASAAALAAEVDAVRRRIAALGVAGSTVRSNDADQIVVQFPAGFDPESLRQQIGQQGSLAFVPLGDTQAEQGDVIDPARNRPLFGGADSLAGIALGTDQTGNRTVVFTLSTAATALFAEYTAAHVGSIVAITIDDRVVTAPMIKSSIPDGQVEISQAGTVGGWDPAAANQLIAILHTSLPAPLIEISDEPGPVTPTTGPTASPSDAADVASPFPFGSPTNDFSCHGTPGYASVVVHVDPSQPEPVWAIADDGRHLRVVFGPYFHSVTNPVPEIRNGLGGVTARDGTTIDIASSTSSSPAGLLVLCALATELRILQVRPD